MFVDGTVAGILNGNVGQIMNFRQKSKQKQNINSSLRKKKNSNKSLRESHMKIENHEEKK